MNPGRTDGFRVPTVHPVRHAASGGTRLPAVTARDRAIARVLLAGAAVGLAWLVFRVPAVRRLAWHGARAALASGLPAVLVREVGAAWRASASPAGAVHGERPHTPAAVPPPGPFSGS